MVIYDLFDYSSISSNDSPIKVREKVLIRDRSLVVRFRLSKTLRTHHVPVKVQAISRRYLNADVYIPQRFRGIPYLEFTEDGPQLSKLFYLVRGTSRYVIPHRYSVIK